MPNLRNGSKGGFEPGLTRLRVRHSTTELPRSTTDPASADNTGTNTLVSVRVTLHQLTTQAQTH